MNKHDFYFGIYLVCTLLSIIINDLPNCEFYFVGNFMPLFALLSIYHFVAKWIIWFTPSKNNDNEESKK